MLTEKEKDFINDVAMFLSGRIKQKCKKEEIHKRKVHYLINRLGLKRFKVLIMRKIREIGKAGPKFMYRALLDVNKQMIELNTKYREELVNPLLYDAIEAIPDINFASFVGANIPEDRLLPFDIFSLPPKDKEEDVEMEEDEMEDVEMEDVEMEEEAEEEMEEEVEEFSFEKAEAETIEEFSSEEVTKKRQAKNLKGFVVSDGEEAEDSDDDYTSESSHKKRKL
jgi:hypothetical protein